MTEKKTNFNIDFNSLRESLEPKVSQTFEERVVAGFNQILKTSDAYTRFTVDSSYIYIAIKDGGASFGLIYKVVEDGTTKVYDSTSLRNAVNNGDIITLQDRKMGRTSQSERELRAKFEIKPEDKPTGAFGAMVQAITPKDSPRPMIEIDEDREQSLYGFIAQDIQKDVVNVFSGSYKAMPSEIFARFDANTQEISIELVLSVDEFNTYAYSKNNDDDVQKVIARWKQCILSGEDRYSTEGNSLVPEEFTEKYKGNLDAI